ncbi:MAG: hypothetical protein HKL90_13955 [Elusimicrobia bacterium]|nr:hypothetical protein [Elusimicrobiota bacterium]
MNATRSIGKAFAVCGAILLVAAGASAAVLESAGAAPESAFSFAATIPALPAAASAAPVLAPLSALPAALGAAPASVVGAAPASAAALPAAAAAEPSAAVAAPAAAASPAKPTARRALAGAAAASATASASAGAAFDASRADRGISQDWVEEMIRRDAAAPPQLKRLRDAAQRQGFSAVALNGKLIARHDDRYTVELPESAVTDQKQSGRCWDFAGLNVIMTGLAAQGRKLPFSELSENYVYFYSLLEKSKSYLDQTAALALKMAGGKKISKSKLRASLSVGSAIDDGGWFEYFEFLVDKYGLVPKSAMPETASSQNSDVLIKELQTSLATSAAEVMRASAGRSKEDAAKSAASIQDRAMARVWKVLATHLGTPPADFDLREDAAPVKDGSVASTPAKVTRYTPRRFASEYIGFHPGDYVVLTNSPSQKKGVVYEVPRSAIGAAQRGQPGYNLRFMDVGAKRLAELVAASIRGGHAAWFASDVIDDVDVKSGIMHPDIFQRDSVYGFSKEERRERLSRKNSVYYQLNQPDHAMAITGYDQPAGPGGPIVKMKVKNSWGASVGSGGFFHMYMQWFRDRVFEVIVHKTFLNPKELKSWEGRARTMSNPNNMF